MLYMAEDSSNPVRIQAPFIANEVVDALCCIGHSRCFPEWAQVKTSQQKREHQSNPCYGSLSR